VDGILVVVLRSGLECLFFALDALFLVGVLALDAGALQTLTVAGMPFSHKSLFSTIGLCIGIQNCFTPANHVYKTQNGVCSMVFIYVLYLLSIL
jgi:hypothetical protein